MSRDKWDDLWENGEYDLVFIDEFKGTKTIEYMNLFVQGGFVPLKKKNEPHCMKIDNLPVIVCSQFDIAGAFPNCSKSKVDALRCRFIEVEIREGYHINFYYKVEGVIVEEEDIMLKEKMLGRMRRYIGGRLPKNGKRRKMGDGREYYEVGKSSFECGRKNGNVCNYVDCDHVF